MKPKIIFLLLIILIINFSYQNPCFADVAGIKNLLKLNNGRVVAWKEINNSRITLANGQEIANLTESNNIYISETQEIIDIERTCSYIFSFRFFWFNV